MVMPRIGQYMLVFLTVFSTVYGFKNEVNRRGNTMSIVTKSPFEVLEKSNFAVDMYEDNGNIIAAMDVPGIDAGDIRVEIEDGQLHIFGQRKEKKEVNEAHYYHKEVRYGSFDRLISLPSDI